MDSSLHNEINQYEGRYRAKVTEVDIEGDEYGAIRVIVPDIHLEEIDEELDINDNGMLAYPANNNLGGYNEENENSYYACNYFTPLLGSYVMIEFEGGDISHPYYTGPWQGQVSKLPPEMSSVDEPHKVYIPIKSASGRSIIVCDSEDQERVEITGKKRTLDDSEGPQGNSQSVYEIEGNQTVILLDERKGKEKLLIKSHKGDYINFDIENRKLHFEFDGDINIKTNGKFSLDAEEGIEIKSNQSLAIESSQNLHILSNNNIFIKSSAIIHIKAAGNILMDGIMSFIQSGIACIARNSSPKQPKGDR